MQKKMIRKSTLGLMVATVVWATTPAFVRAQAPLGMEQQLQMLQQLPEAQRQELLRSLGMSGIGTQGRTDPRLQFPVTVRPSLQLPEEGELRLGPPQLEAGSTIIVRLQLPRIGEEDPMDQPADGVGQQQTGQQASGRQPSQLQQLQQAQAEAQAQARGTTPRTAGASDETDQFSDLAVSGMVDPALQARFDLRVQSNPQLGKVRGSATYVLDREGRLQFRGLATIPLAGLTEYQAARRIEAEPILRPLRAKVLLLPLEPFGVDALEPFGYDLFRGAPVTFAPATDVPVPPDYVIGPGDEVRVQLFGKDNAIHSLVVNRDGSLNFPQIGPIVVAGLGFHEMRDLLQKRVSEQMIGVSASVTMGALRSIRIFVLGDVTRPGSFTVSGLSTMTNALFASGGVAPSGSLRNVRLKRNGRTVQRLDLYDLLLHGDNSDDARLMPNDVLFVPPLGPTVSVAGEVQRPAIYEIGTERTLDEVVHLAGGLLPTAYAAAARVERVDQAGGRAVHTFDLNLPTGRDSVVRGGDYVTVGAVPDDVLTDHVTLAGHVHRPGPYEWRAGMRLSGLIGSVYQLKQDADRNYVLIRRQADVSGPIEVQSADLAAALANPGGPDDPLLHNLDTVTVFDLGSGRVSVIEPLLSQLRLQAVYGSPAQEVEVRGMVRTPGPYPLEEGMRVSDLIRAGANLTDSAYGLTAELTRYEVEGGTRRVVDFKEVDLAAVLAGDTEADLLLQPFDYLNVQRVSQWRRRGSVELDGEVMFPGAYPIEPGETLTSVLARAGGLTHEAFVEGSVFLREDLREREREQLDRLVGRLQSDLATMMLQSGRAAAIQGERIDQSLSVGQSLLSQLRRAEPVGRLVIDLAGLIAGEEERDVVLRDGDRLIVPQRSQEVMVLGEVQYSTSHLFSSGLRRDDYVAASGGLTANADGGRIYIVRANGAVVGSDDSSKWFRRGSQSEVMPGDTIVVPLNVDRVPALALWQSSTTILYNLAIAVAAIGAI